VADVHCFTFHKSSRLHGKRLSEVHPVCHSPKQVNLYIPAQFSDDIKAMPACFSDKPETTLRLNGMFALSFAQL